MHALLADDELRNLLACNGLARYQSKLAKQGYHDARSLTSLSLAAKLVLAKQLGMSEEEERRLAEMLPDCPEMEEPPQVLGMDDEGGQAAPEPVAESCVEVTIHKEDAQSTHEYTFYAPPARGTTAGADADAQTSPAVARAHAGTGVDPTDAIGTT